MQQLSNLIEKTRKRTALRRIIAILCAVTLLLTMNGLKFDADTLERIPMCGYEYEHVHTEACYGEDGALICVLEEHIHTDACYQQRPVEAEAELVDADDPVAEEAFVDAVDPVAEEAEALMMDDDLSASDEEYALEADNDPYEIEEPVFSLLNRDYITASEIAEGMNIDLADIVSVLEVVDEEASAQAVSIEQVGEDYMILPARSFAECEIVLETANDLLAVRLTDGVAALPAEAPVEDGNERIGSNPDAEAPVSEAESGQAAREDAETSAEAEGATPTDAISTEEEDASFTEEADATSAEEEDAVTTEEETAENEEDAADADGVGEDADSEAASDEAEPDGATSEEGDSDEGTDEAESDEAASEDAADETEAGDEEAPDGPEATPGEEAVFTAIIHLEEAELPLSVRAMMARLRADASVEAEEVSVEAEETSVEEAASAEDAEGAPVEENEVGAELSLEYDDALLAVEPVEGDYLVTPVAEFVETRLAVRDGAARYDFILQNDMPEAVSEAVSEAEIAYPAQEFEGATDFVNVLVTAPEGAFPEGTTMTVADVEDESTISDIRDMVEEGFVEVERVHAVDISFWCDGVEIEPLSPISVEMTAVEKIAADRETIVVHVDDAGGTELVEQSAAPEETAALEAIVEEVDSVEFVADAFSIYAYVVAKKLETKVLASDGETYRIEVTYGPNAGIPDGAVLDVEEVTSDDQYRTRVEADLPGNKMITLARFFDIKIMDGAEEVHPAEGVEVRVTLYDEEAEEKPAASVAGERINRDESSDALAMDEESNVAEEQDDHIVTMGDPVVCAAHFEEDVNILSASEKDDSITFMAGGFSVWGVVYTVDFYYGNYEYHLEGEGEILLSGLFELLGIDEDAAQVESVVFTNDELIAVEKVDEDWKLTSLMPFDTVEKLTVTIAGGKVYEIRVEDAKYQFRVLSYDGNVAALRGTYLSTGTGGYYLYASSVQKNAGGNVIDYTVAAGKDQADNAWLHYKLDTWSPIDYTFINWVKKNPDGSFEYFNERATYGSELVGETTFIAYYAYPGTKLIQVLPTVDGTVQGAHLVDNNTDFPQYVYSNENDITAVPDNGKVFKGWYINGERVSQNTVFDVSSVTGNTVLEARFASTYQFHMVTNKTAEGTDPAYFVRAYGETTNLGSSFTRDAVYVSADGVYKADTRYNTVVLNSGVSYEFAYWLKDDGTTPDSQQTTVNGLSSRWLRTDKIIVQRDTSCIAWFTPIGEHIIRLKWPDGGGSVGHLTGEMDPRSVTVSTNNNASFLYYYSSDEVTLTATPDDGKIFVGWYNGDELISTNKQYPVSSATKHMVLQPRFADTYKISVTSNGTGNNGTTLLGQFKTKYPSGTEQTLAELWDQATTTRDVEDEGCTRPRYGFKPEPVGDNAFIGWLRDDGTVYTSGSNDNKTLDITTKIYRDTIFVCFFGPKNNKVVRLLDATGGSVSKTMAPRQVSFESTTWNYYYSSDVATLTAAADTENGYMFVGWYLDGKIVSYDEDFSIQNDLPADVANISTLEARFRKYKTFDVKIAVDAEDGIDSNNVGYLTSDYFEGQQTSYRSLKAPTENGTTGHLLFPIEPHINETAAEKGYRFSQWVRQANNNVIFTLNSVNGTTGALTTNTEVADTDARFIAVFSKGYFIRVKDAQLRVNTDSGKVESKTFTEWTADEKTKYNITEFGGYTTENGTLRSGNNDLFGWSYAYSKDGELTLVAQPKEGYEFVGWFNFTEMVSNNPRYPVSEAKYDMTLVPVFAKQSNNLLVWFDGTNGLEGGMEPYDTFYTRKDGGGNPSGANRILWNDGNTAKPAKGQSVAVTLPGKNDVSRPQNWGDTEFELKGWYNIYPGTTTETGRYFAPGDTVHVTDNTVFYADWFRKNYDVAVDDGHVIKPVDTSSFIHTYMFDYNNLFNMDSIKLNAERSTISSAINYEYWDMKNHVGVDDPQNFVFMTTVSGFGRSMNPAGRDEYNQNRETTTNGTYYSGIVADGILLRPGLKDKIFGHDNNTIGKRFVGEGKNLYQYDTNTGYFYYDSDKNAASFMDSKDEFYLYSYTNATNKSDGGDKTDFLPFNYGKRTFRESYGEVNYWFGMESNIEFFLPNTPGYRDAKNVYGNRATNGKEMVFKFAGDDDVWVYVDDQLVLDMGGVHGKVYGEINFSQNTWTIAQNGAIKKDDSSTIDYIATDAGTQISHGTITEKIPGFKEGEHKLTIYYLERGSSQSNCAIYFNIAPSYTLKLNKRDPQNNNASLQGATFKVFTDEECSQEADVFNTYYKIGNEFVPFTDSRITESMRTKNFTTGADGKIHISGFYAGRSYYLQETSAPDGYPDVRNEVIKITFDSVGNITVDGSLPNAMADVTSRYFAYDSKINGSDIFVPNVKRPLSVQKVWRNIDGNVIDAPDNAKVTLELRRYTIVEGSESQNSLNDKHKVQIHVYYLLDEEGKSVYSSLDAHQVKKAYSLMYEVGYRQSLSFTVAANHNDKLGLMTATGVYAPTQEDIVYSTETFGVGNVTKTLPVMANLTTGPVTRDTSVYLYFIGDVGDPPSIEDYLTITEPTFSDSEDTWGRVGDSLVQTITLPDGGNVDGNRWKYTWDNLETLDADNNKYYYYVKETKVMIGGKDMTAYYTDMYSNTGLSDGGMITVTNADETVRLQMVKRDLSDQHFLAGAKFKIYLSYHGTERPNNILYTPNAGYITSGYEPVDSEYTSKASSGIFYDGYLTAGRYWLVETAAPDGYNLLSGPVEVLVESDKVKYRLPGETTYRVVSRTSESGEPIVIPIDNTPGYNLPSTGGPGTTLYTLSGIALISVALFLLLRKKGVY